MSVEMLKDSEILAWAELPRVVEEFAYVNAFHKLLLWKFCGGITTKHNFATPWREDDWWYATDGKRAIKIMASAVGEINVAELERNGRKWPTERPAALTLSPRASLWVIPADAQFKPLPPITRMLANDGDGEAYDCYDETDDVILDGRTFAREYLYWFSLIPGCDYVVREKSQPALFRWEYGWGLLCPLNRGD